MRVTSNVGKHFFSSLLVAIAMAPEASFAAPTLPAQVSVFFPAEGQSRDGSCWQGLMIDSNDNLYPVAGGQISRILPDGTLVNDEINYFATGGGGSWAVLDEGAGKFYAASSKEVRVAPFVEHGVYDVLTPGLGEGQAIALGRGPLSGSLFVTDAAQGIQKIDPSALAMSVFVSRSAFRLPHSIASAPDGTIYVVDLGHSPDQLTKITPEGVPSTFAVGTDNTARRAVFVDDAGNVYWSHPKGIDKYDASGNLLGTLPGPPDKPLYEMPMGAVFDSKGNLYLLENADCKKIYKYSLAIRATLDIVPNAVNPKSRGVIPVAILTTDTFDATTIDPFSVRFGPNGATEAHGRGHQEDVDGDGDLDLLLHFHTQATGIRCGDTSASLTGQTFDSQTIEGLDSIRTVGCK